MPRFATLFSISLNHPFFIDGIAKGVSLVPDDRTKKMIDACGLLFRKTETGAQVATELDPEVIEKKKMRRALPDRFYFTFKLKVTDPLFYTLTDFKGVTLFEEWWLFGNTQQNQDEGGLILHPGSAIDESTPVIPRKSGFEFSYEWSNNSKLKTAIISDTFGRCLMSETIHYSKGKAHAMFDLSRLEPNMYSFQAGNEIQPFYYDGDLNKSDNVTGLIRIDTGSIPKEAFRLLDDDGYLKQPAYQLVFDVKKTYWRYHIINRSGLDTTDIALESAEYPFKSVSHAMYPETDRLFQSDEPIPMKENGLINIHLKATNGSSARQLIESLPGPGPVISESDPEETETLYSDIFVYI